MTNRIVAFAGYAFSGKDLAAKTLTDYTRLAFADELKKRAAHALDLKFKRVNEYKKELRPFLVSLGATARSLDPDFWIHPVVEAIDRAPKRNFVISDVRYANEVSALLDRGGEVYYIARPGYGPANEEEERSIDELLKRYSLPTIQNIGDKEDLWKRVRDMVR